MSETETGAAAPALPAGVREITLPSGAVARLRRGKGRDLKAAGRVASPDKDPMGYTFALIAQIVEIDGRPAVAEDLEEMDMEDVNALMVAATLPGNFPRRGTSSGSPR